MADDMQNEISEDSKEKKRRTWLRRLVKIGLIGGGLLTSLVVFVLLFVIFLPLNALLQQVALPQAREMLQHEDITVGHAEFYLFDGFELHNVHVGPPKGYTEDLVNLKRLAVHYDLWSALDDNLIVKEIAVEGLKVYLEIIEEKPSVQALLDNLPPSEEKPEEPEEVKTEEEPGEPPTIKITLEKIALTGFEAGFSDGNMKAAFGVLDVHLKGFFSFKETHLDLNVDIAGHEDGKPNVFFSQKEPIPVEAELIMKTDLDVAVDVGEQLDKPKAKVDLGFLLASTKLEGPLDLPPIRLEANTEAGADLEGDDARLGKLSASFNGEELLSLRADLKGLETQDFVLHLDKLRLPFATFAPYARAVLPEGSRLEMEGEAGLENFVVKGNVPKLAEMALPEVEGRIFVRNLGVDVKTVPAPPAAEGEPKPLIDLPIPALQVRVGGLETELDVWVTPEPKPLKSKEILKNLKASEPVEHPTVQLKGHVELGSLAGFGAQVESLRVDLAAGTMLKELEPGELAAVVDVALKRAAYDVPEQGRVETSLHAGLDVSGDLATMSFDLSRMDVDVNDTVKLATTAQLKNMGEKGFTVDFRLDPLSLPKVLAMAPPGALASLPPGFKLDGAIRLDMHLDGTLPPMEKLSTLGDNLPAAFRLPVNFDITPAFENLSVSVPDQKLAVKSLDGAIRLHGTPADITLESPADDRLGIGRIAKSDLDVQVDGVKLPLKLVFKPLDAAATLDLDTGITVERIEAGQAGATVEGLAVSLKKSLGLPLTKVLDGGRFDLGKIGVGVEFGVEAVHLAQEGTTLDIRNPEKGPAGTRTKILRQNVRFEYDPARRPDEKGVIYPISLQSRTKLGNVSIKEQQLDVKNLVTEERIDIAGLWLKGLSLNDPVPKSKPRWIKITGGFRPNDDPDAVGSEKERRLRITKPDALDRPIADNRFDLDILVSIPRLRYPPVDKDIFADVAFVEIRNLEFHNRSHGPKFSLQGRTERIVYPGATLPESDIRLFAGIELPPVTEKQDAAHIIAMGTKKDHTYTSVELGGKVGFEARVRNPTPEMGEFAGKLVADKFHAWIEQHGQAPSLEDGTKVYTINDLHLSDMNVNVPIVQHADIAYVNELAADLPNKLPELLKNPYLLWPPSRRIFEKETSPIVNEMRAYGEEVSGIGIDKVEVNTNYRYVKDKKETGRVDVPLVVDQVAVDMKYEDWVLELNRIYLQLLNGDIGGNLAVQIVGVDPLDVYIQLRSQIGGINLAALDPKRAMELKDIPVEERPPLSESTEIAMRADLDFKLQDRWTSGDIHVTKLSLKHLNELLKFIDPGRKNEAIQDQRGLINAWYVTMWKPQVKLLSLNIRHGKLNEALKLRVAGIQAIIDNVLEGLKVHDLDIIPVLNQYLDPVFPRPTPVRTVEIGPTPDEMASPDGPRPM